MSHKITNLANNELMSIFGGEGCAMCYCYNYYNDSYSKRGFSSLKDFIIYVGLSSETECEKRCEKTHTNHICELNVLNPKPSNIVLGSKAIDTTYFIPVYDRSSVYEYSVK